MINFNDFWQIISKEFCVFKIISLFQLWKFSAVTGERLWYLVLIIIAIKTVQVTSWYWWRWTTESWWVCVSHAPNWYGQSWTTSATNSASWTGTTFFQVNHWEQWNIIFNGNSLCKEIICVICLMLFFVSFFFSPSRSGKYTENINGTLPSYQPVQEEEPQKKQPGKMGFMVSFLIYRAAFEGHWNI